MLNKYLLNEAQLSALDIVILLEILSLTMTTVDDSSMPHTPKEKKRCLAQ